MTTNTIHVNAASRIMRRIAANLAGNQPAGSFADALGAAKEKDALDTYKAGIEERICQMPFDATRASDDVSITISDEGYRAMQADPEYESWVLGTIRDTLCSRDSFASISGGNLLQMRFGAEKAQYRADMWRRDEDGMGKLLGDGEEKSYWEQRAEREEKNREIADMMATQRARVRRANELRRIQGRQLLADTTGMTMDIMNLLISDFLG